MGNAMNKFVMTDDERKLFIKKKITFQEKAKEEMDEKLSKGIHSDIKNFIKDGGKLDDLSLENAIKSKSLDTVKAVRKHVKDIKAENLMTALDNYDHKVLDYLSKRNPHCANEMVHKPKHGLTSTPFSESINNPEAFKLLLANGAQLYHSYVIVDEAAQSRTATNTLRELKDRNPNKSELAKLKKIEMEI